MLFVGERGSKVSQFAKNAPLDMLVLARDVPLVACLD